MKIQWSCSIPILMIALSLGACGKKSTSSDAPAPEGGAVVTAATLSTQFEADCGSDIAAASSAANYDLAQCQLGGPQKSYLEGLGPFRVEADCVRQGIRIHNGADQIVGDGTLAADGTFSVPLTVGSALAEIEGCPVILHGLATGTVTCDADRHVARIDVNTAFTLENVPADGAASVESTLDAAAAPAAAPAPAVAPAPAAAPAAAPAVVPATISRGRDHDGDNDRDRRPQGKQAVSPAAQQKGGKQTTVSPAAQQKGGKQAVQPSAQQKGGKQAAVGKGGQQLGGEPRGGDNHARHVEGCLKFPSCGFASKASLSCSR